MSIHRTIAGLPVTVESPSSYRVVTPNLDTIGIKSWIKFISPAEGWTIVWDESGKITTSHQRWPTAFALAQYLYQLGSKVG